MNRNSLKYFIGFYAIILVLAIIVSARGGHEDSPWLFYGLLVLSVVLMLAIGLFFGMLLSVIFRKPAKENLFYWIGQFMSLALVVSLLGFAAFQTREGNLTNDEKNKKLIDNLARGASAYAIVLAFDTLRAHFKDPNGFLLYSTTTYVLSKDSLNHELRDINVEAQDSLFNVYLFYDFPRLREKDFYAKVRVTGTQVKLEKKDVDVSTSAEYKHMQHVMDTIDNILKDRK
jgi:hypothetical protein